MEKDIFKKHMIKRIKSCKGKSIVGLYINNEMELYNNFSIMNTKYAFVNFNGKINHEIISYLTAETKKIPRENSLIVVIKIPEESNWEIDFIEKLIKENIHERLSVIEKKRRTLNRNALILALIGVVLMSVKHISHAFENLYSLNEFVVVMSWVFMWEATELFFFKRAKRVREAVILMKIYFSQMILEKYSK